MEEKLKTLKDLTTINDGTIYEYDKEMNKVFASDLRNLSIKWIEALEIKKIQLEKKKKEIIEQDLGGFELIDKIMYQGECDFLIKWIKHFFNLTEEQPEDLEKKKKEEAMTEEDWKQIKREDMEMDAHEGEML